MPLILSSGCWSIQNAWLDPTVLGRFSETSALEIRTSLTLEDTPPGIPGAGAPTLDDLEVIPREYPISAGDTLAVEINELRERFIPYQTQALVSPTGFVNIPVVGRVEAVDLTVPEFEERLRQALIDMGQLQEPQVTVNPLFLQRATYSIFGIGVSAANDAPLRAGVFPIRRPDLRLLEAINQVGGLNEFVTDVYVFRYDNGVPEPVAPAPNGDASPEERPPSEPSAEGLSPEPPSPGAEERRGEHEAAEEAVNQLLDAVEGGEGAANEPQDPEPAAPPELLEAESGAPFVFINGEFVQNPTYKAGAPSGAVTPAIPPTAMETVSPAVNWARIAGDTDYRVLRISAERLRVGDPYANIVVRAGDVIRIVSGEIGVYYVMGQVQRVGAFAFNAEQITLKAAIAAAGGLSNLAWPDRCTVYRRTGQREQMIQVNLDRIFAGKDADFIIRRGDIVNVGTHPFAPFLQRIRAATLPNINSVLGYGFTYSRNFADIDSFAPQSNPANRQRQFPNLFP